MEQGPPWERAAVDRLVDGRWAVLLIGPEEREQVVELACLPPGVEAGQWLRVRLVDGELVELEKDEKATAEAAARIAEKMEQLRRRGRRLDPS